MYCLHGKVQQLLGQRPGPFWPNTTYNNNNNNNNNNKSLKFTLEEKSHFYLTQQLSIAIQRGNALSILGTHVPVGIYTSD